MVQHLSGDPMRRNGLLLVVALIAVFAYGGWRLATARGRPAAGKQESLVDLLPANARGAIVLRKSAVAFLQNVIGDDPEMRRELSEFLTRSLGIDLTALRGAVVFTVELGANGPASAGAVLQIDAPVAPLKLPEAGRAHGAILYRADGD